MGTVSKTGAAASKAAVQKSVTTTQNTLQSLRTLELPQLLPYTPRLELALPDGVPVKVVDGNQLKDQLMLMAKRRDVEGTNTAPPKHNNRNIKDIDAYDDIENFLGKGKQTDINPFTGKVDKDRIFVKQKDGSVSAVRIGDHEMRSPNNQHYHLEKWDGNGNFIRPDQSVKINNSKKR